MHIVVASKNPVKIQAVTEAFSRFFPNQHCTFSGVSVSSEVPDQPKSSKETLDGARNRVKNAQREYDADYYVGIEGGIEDTEEGMQSFAWAVVATPERRGKARSATFYLPEKVAQLIREGKELGEADDIVFQAKNSKQKNGAVGILTGDALDRTGYYINTVILALIPFKHPELYPKEL